MPGITIPARLAQMSRSSRSLDDAAARARTLYRNWYRAVRSRHPVASPARQLACPSGPAAAADLTQPTPEADLRTGSLRSQAPEIVEIFNVPVSVYDIRIKIREQFERNQHITDLNVIDILLLKGHQVRLAFGRGRLRG